MKSQGIGVVGRGEGSFRRWRAAMLSDTQQPNKNDLFVKILIFSYYGHFSPPPQFGSISNSRIHDNVILHCFYKNYMD